MSAYAFIFKVNQKNMKMNINVPTYSCLHSDPQKRVTGDYHKNHKNNVSFSIFLHEVVVD